MFNAAKKNKHSKRMAEIHASKLGLSYQEEDNNDLEQQMLNTRNLHQEQTYAYPEDAGPTGLSNMSVGPRIAGTPVQSTMPGQFQAKNRMGSSQMDRTGNVYNEAYSQIYNADSRTAPYNTYYLPNKPKVDSQYNYPPLQNLTTNDEPSSSQFMSTMNQSSRMVGQMDASRLTVPTFRKFSSRVGDEESSMDKSKHKKKKKKKKKHKKHKKHSE